MAGATTSETIPETTPETVAPEVDEARQGVLDTLTEALGGAVLGSHIAPGRALWVRVAREAWFEAAEHAKLRLGFHFFDFLSAIDWMPSPWGRYEDSEIDVGVTPFDPDAAFETGVAGGDTRFQVMCRLANVRRRGGGPHQNVILKADLPDDDLRVASLVPLYGGASWHERECWEMFGITFDGHPGLRHLYLPGEFEGHPLRKDFPLLARLVKPWPGIVDVEPMPGDASTNGTGDGESGHGEGADG
ncbi:MAG TPA: NADH-quinone oxidoreductase subunit C [Acidimicrobiales bacterium]|nr:NADH-quinone oxidoreductase subunit C [Acidimicrobiales bacterium]